MREGRIGLAWLRLDGFVALEADHQGGTVITRPFELEGECLQLNVDASGNGDVRLELLDRAGNPIPDFSGEHVVSNRGVDEIRLQPAWTNHADLSALKGQIVRLKIHLDKARLFAFQIQP